MSTAWTAVLLAAVGTFAMRASFLAAANRLTALPPRAERLLRQIPPAALAALVVPAFVRPGDAIDLLQPQLPAGVLAGLVAWRTRNAALTLVVGIGSLLVLRWLGWE